MQNDDDYLDPFRTRSRLKSRTSLTCTLALRPSKAGVEEYLREAVAKVPGGSDHPRQSIGVQREISDHSRTHVFRQDWTTRPDAWFGGHDCEISKFTAEEF